MKKRFFKNIDKLQTFKYGEVKIPVVNSSHTLVPSFAQEVTLDLQDRKALAIALTHNISTLLIGETGTGKSSAIKYLAYKRKQPYFRVNMNGYTTPDELVGRMAVKDGHTYFEEGIITNAMRNGAILVLDEVNGTTQDCLFVLHGLLDDDKRITLPDGSVVTPHADFRVFATCNPDYEGTKTMNKAFIDRFGIILSIDTLTPAKEKNLLIERTHISEFDASNLVTIATMARKDYLENKISVYVSTRALLNVASLMSQGLTIQEAYSVTIERKTTNKDEQRALKDFFLAVLKYADGSEEERLLTPVITTQKEIEGLKKAVEENIQELNNYTREAIQRTKERDEVIEQKEELGQKLINTQKIVGNLESKIKDLTGQVEAFQKLEEIIKTVSKSV